MRAAALGLGAGISHHLGRVKPIWSDALKAGVVSVPFKDARSAFLSRFKLHHTRVADSEERDWLSVLIAWLAWFGLSYLLEAQLWQDSAFQRALGNALGEAQAQGMDAEAYKAKILETADRFGSGDIADTWLTSEIVAPSFTVGEWKAQKAPELAGAMPYLQFVTMGDDRVRPNHAVLHGFVAAAAWTGWETECLPPLGWGCRCRVVPIPWFAAQDLGWGSTFPQGTAQLDAFRAMGGADAEFPRGLFVLGAAA